MSTDDRYKKAWETLRETVERWHQTAAAKAQLESVLFEMKELIPPPRVYDPAVEWVPVSSGQMPKLNGEQVMYQTGLGDQWIGRFEYPENAEDRWAVVNDVKAWRHLPEPYRGEE